MPTAARTTARPFLIPDRLLCPAWHEDKAATLTFTGGSLYCQLTSQNVDDNEGFVNGALVKLVLQGYGDAACTGSFYEADLDMMVLNAPRGQVTSGSMNFANRSFAIPRAGYYRLVARVSRSGTSYASTILSWNGFAATTRTEFYVSRYFANGFCLGSKADEYVSAWRNDNGLFFEARVPDYGIRLVPWGVQCYVNGRVDDAAQDDIPWQGEPQRQRLHLGQHQPLVAHAGNHGERQHGDADVPHGVGEHPRRQAGRPTAST